jgi:signal transduction histidine kinase
VQTSGSVRLELAAVLGTIGLAACAVALGLDTERALPLLVLGALVACTLVLATLLRANATLEARVVEQTDALEAEMDRLAALNVRLATLQEEERKHFARELHDSIGQLVAAQTLALGAAVRSEVRDADHLAELARLTSVLRDEVYALANRLRPRALDDLGLGSALRRLVADWASGKAVRAEVETPTLRPTHLSAAIETTLYRIVQEALTNIDKHARARTVSVLLTSSGDSVGVVIEDDGNGFDPVTVGVERLGLVGMRERAALLDGELQVESRPGGGTTVAARLPITTHGTHAAATDAELGVSLTTPSSSAVSNVRS